MKKGIYKVPGGKLLKIEIEDADGVITQLKITGDFFMHPEEKIEELEQALTGTRIEKEALESCIHNFLRTNNVTLFGADGESIAHTILISS